MMRRDDDLYRYLVLVGHNLPDPVPGAGSCIFLHIWRGSNEPTAGCTAMAESTILQLLSWLDRDKSPRLVQLSRKNYMRLKDIWGLPEVTP
jgi:L,D-peptidoglycan transpeptidase YkuD (ErfK/YbiS/YcfS/YnhG family)